MTSHRSICSTGIDTDWSHGSVAEIRFDPLSGIIANQKVLT